MNPVRAVRRPGRRVPARPPPALGGRMPGRAALGARRPRRLVPAACGRRYPERGGILRRSARCGHEPDRRGVLRRPGLARFRPWEQLFLWFQGGRGGHGGRSSGTCPTGPGPRCSRWASATARTCPCCRRAGRSTAWTSPGRSSRPAATASRDGRPAGLGRGRGAAVRGRDVRRGLLVGGFNYFRDPAAALREMRRVTRPAAPVIVADEIPDLYRFGAGHLLGLGGARPLVASG